MGEPKDPAKPLAGRVAIVTGAGEPRGMGFAGAVALAKAGADVVITDLGETRKDLSVEGVLEVAGSPTKLRERAREIEAFGGRSLPVVMDVTKKEDIDACLAKTIKTFGGVDILFNNAGVIVGAGEFMNVPEHAWDVQCQVSLKGVALLCQAAIPEMKKRGGGSIINNSSIAGVRVLAKMSAYAAVKAGLIGLTKAIAIEHGPDNIRCNAVCPGAIRTQLNPSRVKRMMKWHKCSEDEAKAMMLAPVAMKRFGEPEEVGSVVAFLASDAASYVTGAAIPIDGASMEGI